MPPLGGDMGERLRTCGKTAEYMKRAKSFLRIFERVHGEPVARQARG